MKIWMTICKQRIIWLRATLENRERETTQESPGRQKFSISNSKNANEVPTDQAIQRAFTPSQGPRLLLARVAIEKTC